MSNKNLRRSTDGDWVVVAYASDRLEAEIVAGLLRSFEVPVFIQQEAVGRIFGLTLGTLGMIKILVPAQFEAVAFTLLDEEEQPDPNTLIDDGNIIIFPEDQDDDDDDDD